MVNIMVTAASGLIGYGITRSLKGRRDFHLIGTSIFEDSPAIAFSDRFLKALNTDDERYISWLLETIKKEKIDVLIPGYSKDVTLWNKHREDILATGVKLVLNKKELIELCDDKWRFYEILKRNNSPYAIKSSLSNQYLHLTESLGSVLLLKPKFGESSKGIVKIESEAHFNKYKDQIGEKLLVQEFVGNDEEEYTTAAFGDGKGSYYATMTHRRKLTKQGNTGFAEVVFNDQIEKTVDDLCKLFKPIGPTNFQFRYHDGVFKLLEINARFSSATSLRTAFGYNEALMTVDYYLNGKIPTQPEVKKGKAIRYFEDYIMYS